MNAVQLQQLLCDILTLCDTWMTEIVETAINASIEMAVLVILFNKPIVHYQSPEPQEALWH